MDNSQYNLAFEGKLRGYYACEGIPPSDVACLSMHFNNSHRFARNLHRFAVPASGHSGMLLCMQLASYRFVILIAAYKFFFSLKNADVILWLNIRCIFYQQTYNRQIKYQMQSV